MTTRIDELLQLSLGERLEIAQALWDSVIADPDLALRLTPAEQAEIDRRLAEHRRDSAGKLVRHS